MFKTELHAHTSPVSPCANLSPEEVVDRYLADRYTSLVVCNHYCDYVIDNAGNTWEEKIAYYLSDYHRMKAYAGDRMHIILGCELRFTESWNDYLIYGITEEFLISHPDLHHMTLKTFSPIARENGFLTVQAHPFRNGMKVMDPGLLDGMETFNGHMGHDSRNPIADAWARHYNLLRTSGTDFHHPHQSGVAGILTEAPVTTAEELVAVLRSGECILHCTGPRAEHEGITDHPAKY